MQAKRVLVLDTAWLEEIIGDIDVDSPEGFRRCIERFKASPWYSVLKRFLESGRENRVIYLGDDGVLAYLFGDRVLDLYGSRTRLRCTRCGHRWWIIDGYTRCPVCGYDVAERDYTPPGERPRQRRLLEAIYEVTSADEAYFAYPGDEPEVIELLLLLVASKFAGKVAVAGSLPPLLPQRIPGVTVVSSLREALER